MEGTIKRRIIMDSKKSSVTEASRKMYRAVLPRATDLVNDILALMATAQSPDEIEIFICDARDAFWQMPLHPDERRFYCAMLRMHDGRVRHLAYVRTAQGSVGAPLAWSQVFGLICRCTSGVLRCPAVPDAHRKQVYVDDPVLALRGTPEATRQTAALAVLSWTVLGVALAMKKGQFGPSVDWIGASFRVVKDGIEATILESRLTELINSYVTSECRWVRFV